MPEYLRAVGIIFQLIKDKPEGFCNGGSGVVGPGGRWVAEPVLNEERLIVADLDPAAVHAACSTFDPAGHYSRPDVFNLTFARGRQDAATFVDAQSDPEETD